ncbi:hypothetical protein ABK988_22620 [Vibrio parahaemolyticus]|nr:hypothetical protein [Vibrio parahaemolyticus]
MSHIHVFNSSIMDDGAVEKGLFDSDDSPEIAAILTMRTSDGVYFLNIKDRDVFGIVKSTLRADSADDDPIYACYTQDDAELISFGVDTLK